jgi:hypothetical protein
MAGLELSTTQLRLSYPKRLISETPEETYTGCDDRISVHPVASENFKVCDMYPGSQSFCTIYVFVNIRERFMGYAEFACVDKSGHTEYNIVVSAVNLATRIAGVIE